MPNCTSTLIMFLFGAFRHPNSSYFKYKTVAKYLSKACSSQSGFRSLLPYEPEILSPAVEARLTAEFLLPELGALEAFFLAARALVDRALENNTLMRPGKPYPLGQCLAITVAVRKLLQEKLDITQLQPAAARGYAAFSAFLAAGGTFRHVWGDLRGEYFQNAFLLGTLYVDVSNDTVSITKPKVEILPFAQSRLVTVTDFDHFQRVAERYWKDTIVPNHVLPDLAPYCPLVHVNHEGKVTLHEYSAYMVALTQAGQFLPSEEALRAEAMPAEIFEYVARVLAGTSFGLASSPAEGRALALRRCREYRSKRWYASPTQNKKNLASIGKANAHLQQAAAAPHLYTGPRTLDINIQSSLRPQHLPRYIPISRSAHSASHWLDNRDNEVANYDAVIPVTAREMFAAMEALLLGFVNTDCGFIPVAVRGLKAGKHTFAVANCRWPGAYVPEAYRHYPFAVTKNSAGEGALSIDANGGLLNTSDKGEPLFNSDGTLAPAALELAASLHKAEANREATARSCAVLQKHGLIEPWPLKFHIKESIKNTRGLYCINKAVLKQVPAAVLEELQRSGALAIAHCQLRSMRNLQLQQFVAK